MKMQTNNEASLDLRLSRNRVAEASSAAGEAEKLEASMLTYVRVPQPRAAAPADLLFFKHHQAGKKRLHHS